LHVGASMNVQDWSGWGTADIGTCLIVISWDGSEDIGKTVSNHDTLQIDWRHSTSDSLGVVVKDSSGEKGNVATSVAL